MTIYKAAFLFYCEFISISDCEIARPSGASVTLWKVDLNCELMKISYYLFDIWPFHLSKTDHVYTNIYNNLSQLLIICKFYRFMLFYCFIMTLSI